MGARTNAPLAARKTGESEYLAATGESPDLWLDY